MVLDGFSDVTTILRAGVYALLWRGCVVYIGQSKCLLSRIDAHRNSARTRGLPSWHPVKRMLFDEVQILPCMPDDLDDIEQDMINRYRPRYNVHHKDPSEVPMLAPIDLEFDGETFVRLNAAPRVLGLVRRA